MTFTFSTDPRTTSRAQRGSVVRLKDHGDKPMMVVRADWKRGVQVRPYEGAINSRHKQQAEARRGTAQDPPEWGAKWVPASDVVAVAVSGRRRRRSR
jgi:hypothetical protein